MYKRRVTAVHRYGLGTICLVAACAKAPAPRYGGDPDQSKDLPKSPAELVQLADRLVAQQSDQLPALDRARAALRRAQDLQGERFETSWRRARVCFLISQQLTDKAQRVQLAEQGVRHARSSAKQRPDRVEGHYFLALSLGQIAEAQSKLSLIKPMLAAAQRAAEIDERYDHAGPLLFIGKVYLQAPGWPVSVGDLDQAIETLQRAVAIAPRPLARVFLAQAYAEDDRDQEAIAQLERALANPEALQPRWREEARELLGRLRD